MTMSYAEQIAAGREHAPSVSCPVCQVGIGSTCVDKAGKKTDQPHATRVIAALRWLGRNRSLVER